MANLNAEPGSYGVRGNPVGFTHREIIEKTIKRHWLLIGIYMIFNLGWIGYEIFYEGASIGRTFVALLVFLISTIIGYEMMTKVLIMKDNPTR
jgi:hypothetical protein